jgi:hypothetical protein
MIIKRPYGSLKVLLCFLKGQMVLSVHLWDIVAMISE